MIIRVNFSSSNVKLDAKLNETDERVGANFGEVQTVTEYVGGELYQGEYEITPKVEAQTLLTAKKVLERNVTIKKIPYAEVQNNANGKTVTIG